MRTTLDEEERRLKKGPLIVLSVAVALSACGTDDNAVDGGQGADPERLRAESAEFEGNAAADLVASAAAMNLGRQLFNAHCASCHGADGRGRRGTTDLIDGSFNYGDTEEAIRTTIRDGRHSTMPSFGGKYGEVDLGQLVNYVQSLGSSEPLTADQQRGKKTYTESCVACHGEDGTGNRELGVPNLTDDEWQHGGSMMNIRLAITRGIESDCPPHAGSLTAMEIELLTAYVVSQRANGGAPSY